jgi:hypothetical protein
MIIKGPHRLGLRLPCANVIKPCEILMTPYENFLPARMHCKQDAISVTVRGLCYLRSLFLPLFKAVFCSHQMLLFISLVASSGIAWCIASFLCADSSLHLVPCSHVVPVSLPIGTCCYRGTLLLGYVVQRYMIKHHVAPCFPCRLYTSDVGLCRVRPPGKTGDTTPSCTDFGDDGELAIYQPATGRRSLFTYDRVFAYASTQEQVYVQTQPLIRSVLDGYNVCIFAYGQTGSGKTHTMSGTDIMTTAGRGINYRALDDLFDLQHQRRVEVAYEIKVQMLEVYNEKVRQKLVARLKRWMHLQTFAGKGQASCFADIT